MLQTRKGYERNFGFQRKGQTKRAGGSVFENGVFEKVNGEESNFDFHRERQRKGGGGSVVKKR